MPIQKRLGVIKKTATQDFKKWPDPTPVASSPLSATPARPPTLSRMSPFLYLRRRWLAVSGIAVLSIVILLLIVWRHGSPQSQIPALESVEDQAKSDEMTTLLKRVGRHFLIPEGADPVVATVLDAPALAKEQLFFQHAVNGDKLLIFRGSIQAVLYSPSRDIIVNVGPVEQPQSPSALAPQP